MPKDSRQGDTSVHQKYDTKLPTKPLPGAFKEFYFVHPVSEITLARVDLHVILNTTCSSFISISYYLGNYLIFLYYFQQPVISPVPHSFFLLYHINHEVILTLISKVKRCLSL